MASLRTRNGGGEALVLVAGRSGHAVIPTDTPLTRLNYFDGKFLRAEHLRAEQEYSRRLVQLSNQAGGPGVVNGFDATLEAGDVLGLGPGLAIDPQGRVLFLPTGVRVSLDRLIDQTRESLPSSPFQVFEKGQGFGGIQQVAMLQQAATKFQPCELDVVTAPGDAPSGPSFYVITIGHAEALCGEEDVFGRLCEEACETETDRPYRIEGVVVRALPLVLPLARSRAVALDSRHTRSLLASAYFADEFARGGSLVSGAGLRLDTWCLGAELPGGADVPIAVVARAGSNTLFLDAWTARRERIDVSPSAYWAGRMAMRPWSVFLAQVLQFQCQLAELVVRSPDPGGADDPCRPHYEALTEARKVLEEVKGLYPAMVEKLLAEAPEREREAERRAAFEPLSGGLGRISEVVRRIGDLRAVFTGARDRILLNGGIVELPAAGWLPVNPGSAESVNTQVRRLVGEGLDLRFCVVRPDFVAHALEEAQHMERISLVSGLEDPTQRPRVDVLVPDGRIVPPPPPVSRLGFETKITIGPTQVPSNRVEAFDANTIDMRVADFSAYTGLVGTAADRAPSGALAFHGAGRADDFTEDGGAFYFGGVSPVPSGLNVSLLVRTFARFGSTTRARTVEEKLEADEVVEKEAALRQAGMFGKVTETGAEAMKVSTGLRATEAVFGVQPQAGPPVFASAAGEGLAAMWLGLSCAENPFELGPAESTQTELRGAVSFPGATPSLLDVRILGSFRVTRQPVLKQAAFKGSALQAALAKQRELGQTVSGHFSGVLSIRTIVGDDEGTTAAPVELDLALIRREKPAAGQPPFELRIRQSSGIFTTVAASWGGSPLHVDVDVRRVFEQTVLTLAQADLDESEAVFTPGNRVNTIALSALEIVGAALGDPDFSVSASQLLFPPPPKPPAELTVTASRDWVLFHRRRDKDCAERQEPVVVPGRTYELWHVAVDERADAAEVRRALLENDEQRIRTLGFTPVDLAAFESGSAQLVGDPDDVLVDWRAARPGPVLLYGAIATHGGADGEALGRGRLASIEGAIAPATEATAETVFDTMPFVPAPLARPGADGSIVLVSLRAAKTCHSVYRLDREQRNVFERTLKESPVKTVELVGAGQLAKLVGEATFTGDGSVPDTTPVSGWTQAGGGTPARAWTFSRANDEAAGGEALQVARAQQTARKLGTTVDVPANAFALDVDDVPGECPVVTVIAAVETVCHAVFGLATASQDTLSAISQLLSSGDIASIVGQFQLKNLGTIAFAKGTSDSVASTLTQLDAGPAGQNPWTGAVVTAIGDPPESEDTEKSQAAVVLSEVGLAGEGFPMLAKTFPPGVTCPFVTLVFATPNVGFSFRAVRINQ